MATSLRETILEAAVAHVAAHGPDSLSFRKLATDAGVSHQAPYHHFNDRRGIFRAIAFEGFTNFSAALRSLENSKSPVTAEDLLVTYVEFALDNPGYFRVMFRRDLCEMDDDVELALVADDAFEALVDYVRTTLGKNASIVEIRARATAMWSLSHGLAMLFIEGPLETKVGPIKNRRAFIKSIARQSGF